MRRILSALFALVLALQVRPTLAQIYPVSPFAATAVTLPTPRGNFVLDMATEQGPPAKIWIATNKGPSYSSDFGQTWRSFYGTGGFVGDSASCAAIAFKGSLVAVSTATVEHDGDNNVQVGTGIHVSRDNGDSWIHYPQPKDPADDSIIQYGKSRIRALPVTVNQQNVTYSISIGDDNTIWIASFAGGIRKSTDFGQTFTRVVLPPSNLTRLRKDSTYNFIMTPVPRTDIFGSDEFSYNFRAFSVLANHDTIWAGTAEGINRSTDGGIEWDKFNAQNSGMSGNFVVDLRQRGPGEVWASTGKAVAGNERNGISYTTNNGAEWQTTSDILADSLSTSTALVHKLAFARSLVYAANDEGVWRSSDNGVTWSTPSLIYSRSPREVVTRREMLSVGALDTVLFVGTSDGLVSTYDSPNALVPFDKPWRFLLFAQPLSTAEDSTYAYPNPFQPTQEQTRIRYGVHGNETVTIEILDFKLRLVRSVIRDVQRIGAAGGTEFKELWDGTDNYGHRVPNGTYLYKVTKNGASQWGKIVVIR